MRSCFKMLSCFLAPLHIIFVLKYCSTLTRLHHITKTQKDLIWSISLLKALRERTTTKTTAKLLNCFLLISSSKRSMVIPRGKGLQAKQFQIQKKFTGNRDQCSRWKTYSVKRCNLLRSSFCSTTTVGFFTVSFLAEGSKVQPCWSASAIKYWQEKCGS